jgi:uncharacterized membrane protein YcaP (DUF421 family)
MDPLRLIVRIVFAYTVALLFVRITGHREIKHTDIQTFIVSLIIGDLFDDVIWLEIPASQFVAAVASLFLVHAAANLSWFNAGRRAWRAS